MHVREKVFANLPPPFTAEKRFETLNDLVEDGLISMYIEMNAKDYIDTMMDEDPPPTPPERSEASRRRISSSDANEQKEMVNT